MRVAASYMSGGYYPPYDFYFTDFNIGLKYKVSDNWIIKAAVHNQKGLTATSAVDNPSYPNLKATNRVIAASITYAF